MLIKLNNQHYIKAEDIDEVQIDANHNRVKITSYVMGVKTIEPEHGESLDAIAERIIAEVNGTQYSLFEAQTR
jgi:hypothetical protein